MRAYSVVAVAHDTSMLSMLCASIKAEPSLRLAGRCRAAEDAVRLAAEARPDVIALDMQLPDTDCLLAIGSLRAACGARVVAMSAVTGIALRTLDAGAADFVYMPVGGSDSDYGRFLADAMDRIKLAAASKYMTGKNPSDPKARSALVAVAASKGGPVPLAYLISRLPQNGPAIVCAQWNDDIFNPEFAGLLARMTKRAVAEGQDGMALSPGDVCVVGGNRRVTVSCDGGNLALRIRGECRSPAEQADALLASAADALGARASGVLLSGARAGGAGLKALAARGAQVIRLNKNAILRDIGYSDEDGAVELPLEDIMGSIC